MNLLHIMIQIYYARQDNDVERQHGNEHEIVLTVVCLFVFLLVNLNHVYAGVTRCLMKELNELDRMTHVQ